MTSSLSVKSCSQIDGIPCLKKTRVGNSSTPWAAATLMSSTSTKLTPILSVSSSMCSRAFKAFWDFFFRSWNKTWNQSKPNHFYDGSSKKQARLRNEIIIFHFIKLSSFSELLRQKNDCCKFIPKGCRRSSPWWRAPPKVRRWILEIFYLMYLQWKTAFASFVTLR